MIRTRSLRGGVCVLAAVTYVAVSSASTLPAGDGAGSQIVQVQLL